MNFKYDIIAVTGKYDPLFERDIQFLEFARSLGDELVVILLNDYTVGQRHGFTGISTDKRIERLEAIDAVDVVILSQHGEKFRRPPFTEYELEDLSIGYELEQLKPAKFVSHDKALIEQNKEACKELDIPTHFVSIGVYEYYAENPIQI